MKNNDKAFIWLCNDCSEEAPSVEKLAVRLQTTESKQISILIVLTDANKFKEAFNAAKLYNQLVKDGKTEELVDAPVIEDVEEKVEDDANINKTADEDGAGGEADE